MACRQKWLSTPRHGNYINKKYMPEGHDFESKPNKNIPSKLPFIDGGSDQVAWDLERQRQAKLEAAQLKAQIPIEKKKTNALLVKIRNFMYNLIHRN